MSKGSVLDQSEIKVVVCGTSEGVAPERTEASAVWAGPAGDVDGNVKKGPVSHRAHPEIVITHRAAGRQVGHRNQVRTITSTEPSARLLHSRKDSERRTRRERC